MTRQKQNRQLANNCTLGVPKKLKIEIVIFGTKSQPTYALHNPSAIKIYSQPGRGGGGWGIGFEPPTKFSI